jgi:triacylglycerol lipase
MCSYYLLSSSASNPCDAQDNIGLGKLDAKHVVNNQLFDDAPNNSSYVPSMLFAADPPLSSSKESKSSLSYNSLPSSFTTLLLSMLDSPAYANLTTKYLNDIFNPATPDAPGVKYFSVAGRIDGVSIWHPLWLPKMVLDGVESRARDSISSQIGERNCGNDCLVSVQSAKWGEFLGVLEGCDHWDMRGARGLDLGVDFSSVSMPSFARSSAKKGEQDGDRWSLKDWRRFVKLWKSEEDKAVATASLGSPRLHVPSDTAKIRDGDRENALKSSTDKVSAVFDWIIKQVPSVSRKDGSAVEKERSTRRDLATKDGLERLYVALSRKLYDEGL